MYNQRPLCKYKKRQLHVILTIFSCSLRKKVALKKNKVSEQNTKMSIRIFFGVKIFKRKKNESILYQCSGYVTELHLGYN